MAKYSLLRLAPILAGTGLVVGGSTYIYKSYQTSIAPSNFELAAKRLGFNGYKREDNTTINASEQQESLLKQLQMAGYFKPQKVWQDINRLGIKNPHEAFKEIYNAIKKSQADQEDPHKFKPKILRKNLGKGTELDVEDCMDLILYISQNAFGRQFGQTRHELLTQSWMDKYKDEYLTAAKNMGLIDRINPQHSEYDICWIAGASRIGTLCRVFDYYNMILNKGVKIKGDTLILSGAHEISANIEGVTPAILSRLTKAYREGIDLDTIDISLPSGDPAALEEGKAYLLYLAARYGIKLNPTAPLTQCFMKDECPPGRYPGKIYANLNEGEGTQLTETLMVQDTIASYPPPEGHNIKVISSLVEKDQKPTTASTVRTATERFVESILKGEYGNKKDFIILLQSNNPYLERQTIVTQKEIDKVLIKLGLDKKGYTVKVEGAGYGCKQGVAPVHSELAALIAEKWEIATESMLSQIGITPKRPIENLKFQTRDNSSNVPAYPDIPDTTLSGNIVKEFFDEFLA